MHPKWTDLERSAALAAYRIIDGGPEPEFDAIAELAAQSCDAPMALISFVDDGRYYLKAELGLGELSAPLQEGFCNLVTTETSVVHVDDTLSDDHLAAHPLVVGPRNVRFYAGAPLRTPKGIAIGSLCVFDTKPHELSPGQLGALKTLADQVMLLLELRLEARRLDDALAAQHRFLATVCHDLRTPLEVVGLSSSILRARSGPEDRAIAERLDRSVQAMQKLVDDLLDFESIASGEMRLRLSEMSVEALLDEVGVAFGELAAAHRVDLVIEACNPATIVCDPERVLQIFGNLLSNAVKFTPPGGRVVVRAELMPEAVRFTVEDTGPGLPTGAESRVFEPYWRGETTMEGTGIGLSIVRRLVEAHSGSVAYDPGYENGARFWFTMPRGD